MRFYVLTEAAMNNTVFVGVQCLIWESFTDISEDSAAPSPELKMEAQWPSEGQLILYPTTWSHNLEDYSSYVLLGTIYIHKMTPAWCSYVQYMPAHIETLS